VIIRLASALHQYTGVSILARGFAHDCGSCVVPLDYVGQGRMTDAIVLATFP
jgi:hypothetical protein